MGLFDTVRVIGKFADKVVCANGHKVPGEFQTKDLNQGMHEYIIDDCKFAPDAKTRTAYHIAPIESFTGEMRIYSVCELCPKSAWCEFLFLILDNEVVGFKTIYQQKVEADNIIMKDPYFEHEND